MAIIFIMIIYYNNIMCVQVAEAKITEKKINEARENYRPAAARASLLYFILNDLYKINPLYQFSLKVYHTCISVCISMYKHAIEHYNNSPYVSDSLLCII